MNGQQGYTQMPCVACGAQVTISTATYTGTCANCHAPNTMQAAPQAGMQPPGTQQPYAQPPGMQPPGMQQPYVQPPSMQPPGMQQPYAQPPGMQPPGMQPPGMQPPAGGFSTSSGATSHAYTPTAGGVGMPAPPPGMSMPAAGYGMSKKKIASMVAGAIGIAVLSGGGYFVKKKFFGGKGKASYAKLEIDPKRAEPDHLIATVSGLAHKWRRDAVWWAINVHNVRVDGTVDLTSHGAEVTYISPHHVQSMSKKLRKNSIKKFSFGARGVNYLKKYDAPQRWENLTAPEPSCAIKDLVEMLKSRGFAGDKKVRISYDPKFAFSTAAPSWRVFSDNPELDGWYSMDDCVLTKPGKSAEP